MNRSIAIRLPCVALSFLLLSFLILAAPSHSASAQELSVGVVDKALVANASKAWKTFKKQLDGDVKRWQNKVRNSEAELAKQSKALLSSKQSLSPTALRDKQLALQKRGQKLNAELGKTRRALDQRVLKAEQILNKAINEATGTVGRERGLTLVLNAAMVVHSDKNFDLTKEVAAQVNKRLKQLPKN